MTSEEDLEFCTRQVLRLAPLYNFPSRSQPAIEDLVAALMNAPTQELAKAVIDKFKSVATPETRCPSDADIRLAVHEAQPGFHPDPDCKLCGGVGEIFGTSGGYSHSKRCTCRARRPAPVYPQGQPMDLSAAVKKLRVQ